MDKNYGQVKKAWLSLLVMVGLLLSGSLAQAQSGPVGNEWIVPGQQYYKVKIVKDGLYKLDYQYLTRAGIAGVAPSQLQVWRRGRELARYVGGNAAVLDPTTFLEFYAVHNDALLDDDLYKRPQDKPNNLFNFYTDTAAYFITWSTGAAARPGRAMAQPTATGGAVHPNRMATQLYLHAHDVKDKNYGLQPGTQFLPWVEPGEGYFWTITLNYTTDSGAAGESAQTMAASDSVMRSVSAVGQSPFVEVGVFGVTETAHNTEVLVKTPSGVERTIGVIQYQGFTRGQQRFPVLRSDINSAGKVVLRVRTLATTPAVPRDFFALCYVRLTAPQNNRWFADRNSIAFKNDSLLSGPATYELDSIPATAVGFDVQDFYNVQRIVGTTVTSTRRRFVFPSATSSATRQLYLADESHLRVPPLPARRVYFRQINPATPNFIIITHPQLMRPATGTSNAALSYASYRANPGPGGTRYDTLMVTTYQLYDQFNYGDRSWLAMRRFGRWMAAATTPVGTNRYLLLLGKGIVMVEFYQGQYFRFGGERGLDLVPSSSRSVSDNLLTADFANGDYTAKLHTGRLTATTPQQVMNYLNKLRTHEALPPAAWRKNVLHLTGEHDAGEAATFAYYMGKSKARVERPLFGGTVTTKSRGVRANLFPVYSDISPELNNGLALITYIGHASSSTLALDFGKPSTSLNYVNTNKYPALFLDGCGANFTFVATPTIVEDWLFADQKGALGSLSDSGFGYPDPLGIAQDTLYKILFNEPAWYGKPVTVANDECVRRLQRNPFTGGFINSDTDIEQLLAKNWQGDPAFALFTPAQPDFVASNSALSITPIGQPAVRSDSPTFTLNVGVSNPGKITYDSVQIRVTRRFTDSGRTTQVYPLFKFRQAWRADTTYALTLPNIVGESGSSRFLVEVDPNNRVAESNENNNTAQIDFIFLKGGLSVLRPTEFAIVSGTQPQLTVQSNNPNEVSRVYEFELDTVATFNSSLVRRTTVTNSVVATWTPAALPTRLGQRDSLVWYWRARFQTVTPPEDGNWVTSSFRVIPGSPGGWSQSHYAQFKRDARTGVDVSPPAKRWDFVNTRVALDLRTKGGGIAGTPVGFEYVPNGGISIQTAAALPAVIDCGVKYPNLLIAVYDGISLRPVPMPATFQRCGLAPDYFYYFSASDPTSTRPFQPLDNLNSSTVRQQQLDAFLTAIPNGSYVAVVSANRLTYSTLPAALKARIQTLLGSQLITTLADGEPLALLGQKLTGTTGRLVHETGPNRTSSTAAVDQYVTQRDTLQRPSSSGRIVSTRIGPAQQWGNLYKTIRNLPGSNGQHALSVVAIDTVGRETVLLNATPYVQPQPLTTRIPAARYPYIRLELAVADTVTRIPPQLYQWLVTSRGLPEGIVRRDNVVASAYAAATLTRMATDSGYVRFPVSFQNVSDESFAAPLLTRVNLRSGNTIAWTGLVTYPTALASGQTASIMVRVPMRQKFGTFTIEVVVNPRLQPEQNYANNQLTLDQFTVIDTNVPPMLDVAFDGRRILNGELVSSQPRISIELSDEGRITHITDRTAFTVSLLKPGQTGTPTLVNLNGPEITFFKVDSTKGSTARLVYEPAQSAALPDGVYELRVQGRDPSNAAAGMQNYQTKFEVVNASQISNVYPYPNPVVSKARFVFTLTGQTLPTNMKIQIMSLTGRVVREIFMSELGPLHIGNNITEFAWDGTDTYGDRLANGTYLYRVILDDPSGQFGHRDTDGDRAFKNDWGKLVLMR